MCPTKMGNLGVKGTAYVSCKRSDKKNNYIAICKASEEKNNNVWSNNKRNHLLWK